jgi:hypothetical protein
MSLSVQSRRDTIIAVESTGCHARSWYYDKIERGFVVILSDPIPKEVQDKLKIIIEREGLRLCREIHYKFFAIIKDKEA